MNPAARGVPLSSAEAVMITEMEISSGLLTIMSPKSSNLYRKAIVLARLHDVPLGLVEVPLDDKGSISSQELAERLWLQVGEIANAHLIADGLPTVSSISAVESPNTNVPRCIRSREAFLARPPRLTVVIPTRDRPEQLEACIERILTSSYPRDSYEIVIVDNSPSTSRTRVVVDRLSAEHAVRYTREDSSGSASARNTGLNLVTTDLVVFTDDDASVDKHWMTYVAMAFANNPDAVAVTGSLLPSELETGPQLLFEQYGGFSRGFTTQLYNLTDHRRPDALYPYTAGVFGTGNNMSFRTAQLRDLGGFDPALGNGTPALGGVDSEALLRTIVTGHTIVYEPAAIVWHQHRPDYPGLRRQVFSYGVGLTAYLLKTVLYRPDLLWDFVSRIPRGLAFALNPASGKNEGKQSDYPSELTRLELYGMLYGPIAYLRSRRKYGRHRIPAWARARRVSA